MWRKHGEDLAFVDQQLTLHAALHESGNGMARPRPAAILLDYGWGGVTQSSRSTRCAHLSSHWIGSARLGSTSARTRSIWSGSTRAVRLFCSKRSPGISLDAGSAISRAA